MERAQVFLELDLNKYSASVDLLVNGKDFLRELKPAG
jgi:hypothetical protein